jgi:hypothetical protein
MGRGSTWRLCIRIICGSIVRVGGGEAPDGEAPDGEAPTPGL